MGLLTPNVQKLGGSNPQKMVLPGNEWKKEGVGVVTSLQRPFKNITSSIGLQNCYPSAPKKPPMRVHNCPSGIQGGYKGFPIHTSCSSVFSNYPSKAIYTHKQGTTSGIIDLQSEPFQPFQPSKISLNVLIKQLIMLKNTYLRTLKWVCLILKLSDNGFLKYYDASYPIVMHEETYQTKENPLKHINNQDL